MDLGIKGKWALVGGASKGLGLGCAQALAAEGVNLVMVARGAEALQAAAQAIRAAHPGVAALPVAADITTPEGRAAAFGVAGGPGKAFDIVVTNAGRPATSASGTATPGSPRWTPTCSRRSNSSRPRWTAWPNGASGASSTSPRAR